MTQSIKIRQMTRGEVDDLVSWAALEGWNPGLHDADIFWKTDPEAFVAADFGDELIGGGAITAYNREFGFMGFFIVRPEFRGRGFGHTLWKIRRQKLVDRLDLGASIGMDGVFDMQSYYAKGGFVYSHRNLRFCLENPQPQDGIEKTDLEIVPIKDVPFEQLLAYDRTCFPALRPHFLKLWISQQNSLAVACLRKGELCGFGVARRCREGVKIGPLFADDKPVAEALFSPLAQFARGGPLYLDVPENNDPAMALVADHQMKEVFGCARMYLGSFPDLAHHRIFGVTTFELG